MEAEYPLDEKVMLVSNEFGVDSLEELVMTERLSLDRVRPLAIRNDRGMTLDMRSARVCVDFVLACCSLAYTLTLMEVMPTPEEPLAALPLRSKT